MSVNENLAGAPVSPADLIAEYIGLRDKKEAAVEKIKDFMNTNFNARMLEIEGTLLNNLNQNGADSMKTVHGTAFKKIETSITTADGAEFKRHVVGTEDWDLIDFRPNKTAVKEFVENNDGLLPPGINMKHDTIVQIRRPS